MRSMLVDERCKFSLGMWWRFGEHCHGVSRSCSNSSGNSRVQNFNLRTFLKISDILPFTCDLIFFFNSNTFFSESQADGICISWIIGETKVIQAGSSKTSVAQSRVHSLYQKMQVFFLSYCFLMLLCQTCLTPSCEVFFFSIFSWYHFRNTSLVPPSPQRSVASILKGEKITYLYFLFSADTQTQ